jgi:hypothetical protein
MYCGACDLISKGAISFENVDKISLREEQITAERTGDFTGVYEELKKIQVVRSPTSEQLFQIQKMCYMEAFQVFEQEGIPA